MGSMSFTKKFKNLKILSNKDSVHFFWLPQKQKNWKDVSVSRGLIMYVSV